MAYIGRTPDIGNFEKQILTPDSVTTTFALTYAVGSANSLYVNYGGVPQEPQVAYSVSGGGQQIVFSEAPVTGTTLYIIYYGKQLTTPRAAGQETTKQTFAGDGSTVTFTLTDPPVVPAGIMVFVDGILQREGSGNNYVSSGSTITFTSAPDSSAEIDVYTLVKEKVSIDTVADGSITVAKLAASHPTWNSAGDFTFPLTGSRIRGDFTNGTLTSRVAFQSSTTNGATGVYALPNGTSTTAGFTTWNNSDPTNAGNISMLALSGDARFQASLSGTGTYLPITFYTGGSERARIDTSGNVGIGTTTPDAKLDVTRAGNGQIAVLQTSANRGFSFDSSSDTALQIASVQGSTNMDLWANTLTFSAGGSERMRIRSDGILLLGTTSDPSGNIKFRISGTDTITPGILFNNTTNTKDYSIYVAGTSFNIRDNTVGENRITLDTSGNVGIGTSPNAKLEVNGQIRPSGTTAQAIYIYGAPSTTPYITINQYGVRSWDIGAGYYSSGTFSIQSGQVNGVYLGATATSWASASDERLKDIIEPIGNALTKVNGLRSVIGKYKTDEEGVRRSFLIAQDIQTQFPEALESSNSEKLGIQYTDVIPLLVASIKELKAIVDAQAVEIAALKAK